MEVGVPELLIILVIVVLLFGVGRIGKVAGELGSGIRAFREGLKGDEDEAKPSTSTTSVPVTSPTARQEAAGSVQTAPVEEVIVEEVATSDNHSHPQA